MRRLEGVLVVPVQPSRHFTPEEYLDLEIEADYRSEYINGEIYVMAGASEEHNIIAGNIYAALRPELRGSPCRMFMSEMRVKVEATELYTYPDVVVVCGEREYEVARRGMSLLNPVLIVEVLSESTEAYDRGARFQHYRQIPTLREYLLVAQEKQQIERFFRTDSGEWLLTEAMGPEGTLPLRCIMRRSACPMSTRILTSPPQRHSRKANRQPTKRTDRVLRFPPLTIRGGNRSIYRDSVSRFRALSKRKA
jgi:Uma2 family endonuclease